MTALPFKHCLLAETTRVEQGGKSSLLGFFGVAPGVSLRATNLAVPLASLSFVFIADPGDFEGERDLTFRVLNPDGSVMAEISPARVRVKRNRRLQMIFEISPAKFISTGTYRIQLFSPGETPYENSFDVEEGEPETGSANV